MKKSIVILLHIGYWMLYWFLFTYLYFVSKATTQSLFDEDWAVTIGLASLTGFISFYLFYSWLVPTFLTRRKLTAFLSYGLLISISTGILIVLLISLTIYSLASIYPEVEGQAVLWSLFTLLAMVNGILGTVTRGFITWYTDIHVKETLANKTLRTELALLKAQINPHFLFNTLNNIDILIEHDAPRASLYLNKLSDLLRFVLYETQADLIPLSQELDYIKKYLELQKIRTTNEHYVTLQIDGKPEGMLIAPMLFVPYIENAFKYAANKKVSEAIRIWIRLEAERVHFQCINVIDTSQTTLDAHRGLGNELLRQRLALLYPERHTLTVENTGAEYVVNLELPTHVHELSAD